MTLPAFDVLKPQTLDEALEMVAKDPQAMPIAGGTNLIVDARAGKLKPETVIDLSALDELQDIAVEGHEMAIGACVTIAELLDDPDIRQYAPVLSAAAQTFANTLIRHRATVGGNLVNNAPCADTAPALLVLDANVELASLVGTRSLPLEEFLLSPFATKRQSNEILTAVRFPIPPTSAMVRFQKMGLRKISCMAKVDVAMLLDFDHSGICTDARIALAAACPVAFRARDAEEALVGQRLTAESIQAAANLAEQAAVPRPGSEYKQQVVAGLTRRLLSEIAEEVGETHV